jgi:transketolase
MIATRKASHKVIQWAAARVPHLVSGSADLEPSTLTLIQDGGSVAKGDYAGRNVHYGVREHGMGAIVNGLNLHGLRAFGSTFFNFVDYMKPAVRLAAIMHLPSIFVFTHDSIGLGEDGPTHQPIEQLAHLRATPNLYMVRPAGANETALAWRFAIEQTETPVAMALSRQGLPMWNPSAVPDDCIHRGAYVLRHSYKEGDPDLILIGTGSELHVCTAAADLLEADGVATRVVSAPCLDRFAEQDQDYRDRVLPPTCRARVSVEAASPLGWSTWVGDDGEAIGMTTYGASAPHSALYEHFGFTPERVAEHGKAVVERLTTSGG